MGKRILILDDDADFNNLLTDIYTQADYDVVSEQEPEQAVERFAAEHFDLVVTDQKMPGLSGEEFIREIKRRKPQVPVIMVSGYLDNDTIRNLIREGVGGVFLKPLNVFSLIKRTSALIEESEASGQNQPASPASREEHDTTDFRHTLPFAFESFPCRASKSQEFAKKCFAMRGFKNNLVLIGEEGSDLASLLHDMSQFDRGSSEVFRQLDLANVDEANLLALMAEVTEAGAERLTLLIPRVDLLSKSQLQVLFAASKQKGAFAECSLPLRFVLFVHEDIDLLYDTGRINDDLYMFLGTSEVKLPKLREIRDDIPIIAQRAINAESKKQGQARAPRLDQAARAYLREHEWSGGVLELKRVARAAAHLDAGQTLTRDDLEKVTLNVGSGHGSRGQGLRNALKARRDDYIRAVYVLLDEDKDRTATALDTDSKLLDSLVAKSAAD